MATIRDLFMLTQKNNNLYNSNLTPDFIFTESNNINNDILKLSKITSYQTGIESGYYNENYNISQEDIRSFIESIINKIKEFISKINNWVNTNWDKIKLEYYSRFGNFSSLTKELRYIRDKNEIWLSKKTLDLFYRTYPNIDVKQINKITIELNNSLLTFENYVKDFINGNKKELLVYDIGGETKTFNGYITKKENHNFKESGEDGIEIPYNNVLELSKNIEIIINNISIFNKSVKNVNNIVLHKIEELKNNSLNTSVDNIKELMSIQSECIPNILRWYTRSISIYRKLMHSILKDNIESGANGYQLFINTCLANPDFYNANNFKKDLGDPKYFKLVNQGDYLYIDFKCTDTSEYGYGTAFIDLIIDGVTNTKENQTLRENTKEYIGFDTYKLNLVFLDTEAISNSKGLIDFKTSYWHEVGHVVTHQQELVYKVNSNNFKDSWYNLVERYISHPTENIADAYACLMSGKKPEDIWESRLAYLYSVANKQIVRGGRTLVNYDDFLLWRDDISNRKEEYVKKVKSHFGDLRSKAKLSKMGWLRSYIMNK